jgi:hypothetical protein
LNFGSNRSGLPASSPDRLLFLAHSNCAELQPMETRQIPRAVYHLVHRNADSRWHLSRTGGDDDIASFDTKEQGRQDGERRGRAHLGRGELAQLVVHREDGSIETEFTYGDDPRDVPG